MVDAIVEVCAFEPKVLPSLMCCATAGLVPGLVVCHQCTFTVCQRRFSLLRREKI